MLRVQPDDPVLRRMVLDYLKVHPWLCQDRCVAIDTGTANYKAGVRRVAIIQGNALQEVVLAPGSAGVELVDRSNRPSLSKDSKVEIREVPKRYVIVDGKPLAPLAE